MSISWKTSTGSSATSKEPRANRFFLDVANLEALWNRVFEGATNRGTGARQQIGQRPAVGRHQFRHLPPRNPFEPDFAADARRQLFSACACGQRSRGSFHCCGGISGRETGHLLYGGHRGFRLDLQIFLPWPNASACRCFFWFPTLAAWRINTIAFTWIEAGAAYFKVTIEGTGLLHTAPSRSRSPQRHSQSHCQNVVNYPSHRRVGARYEKTIELNIQVGVMVPRVAIGAIRGKECPPVSTGEISMWRDVNVFNEV